MKRALTIIVGNLLITGAYAFITVPNEIINGGVTSFSMVLGQVCRMDISVFVNLLTLFLLLLCLVFLGREFFAGSVLSCACYLSMFTFFHSLGLPLPLCIMLAGILVGAGYYLCICAKSTAISFDIIALILNKKNPKVNIAYTMGIINTAVLLTGFMVFGLSSVLYGILFTVIQTFVLNTLQTIFAKPSEE